MSVSVSDWTRHVRVDRLTRIALTLLVFMLAPTLDSAIASAADPPPNIVFIMADDLGWADVEFHGGNAPTPNLNRLAAQGLELTQHYVAPVCSPTRTGLMTGRFWSRFGVTSPQNERALPWDTVTLPRALKSVGYATCLTGKWHLGSKPDWGPNHFGFDHSYGSLAGGVGPWNHFYKKGPFTETWHRNERLIQEPGHVTDLIAAEAIRWLEERSKSPSPFFLYVPFTAVHLPVMEPDSWLAKVPAAIQGDVPRHYAACVMHLDDAVGRIVATLDKIGKRSNTLVVFTSDNGGSTAENYDRQYPADDYPTGKLPGNNQPLRGQKGDLFEGGICVPAIVSWPGKIAPGKCSVPVHISDWMPTFCFLAKYAPSKELKWDGRNVWPAILGEETTRSSPLYWVAPGFRSRAVRVGDWKLIQQGDGEQAKHHLFQLADDPGETRNLSEQNPLQLREMLDQLRKVADRDRDSVANDR